MRRILFAIFLISIECQSDIITPELETGAKKFADACSHIKSDALVYNNLCDSYLRIKSSAKDVGDQVSHSVMKYIPFPQGLAFTGFILKGIVDKKVEIDPRISSYGRPKLEIKQDLITLKVSYDFNL